jgi:hypothetical protein
MVSARNRPRDDGAPSELEWGGTKRCTGCGLGGPAEGSGGGHGRAGTHGPPRSRHGRAEIDRRNRRGPCRLRLRLRLSLLGGLAPLTARTERRDSGSGGGLGLLLLQL